MSVLEAVLVLETEAQHSVHRNVGEPSQSYSHDGLIILRQTIAQ